MRNHEQLLDRHTSLESARHHIHADPLHEIAIGFYATVSISLPSDVKDAILSIISLELAAIERTLSEAYPGKSWNEVKSLIILDAQLAEIDKELENLHAKQSELRSKLEVDTLHAPKP